VVYQKLCPGGIVCQRGDHSEKEMLVLAHTRTHAHMPVQTHVCLSETKDSQILMEWGISSSNTPIDDDFTAQKLWFLIDTLNFPEGTLW